MSRSHNKKRNVGIIYEQIIRFVCNSLLNEDKETAESAIKIIKKHFNSNSQLLKEYKLFKALATTNNISDQLAYSIINEAKKACNNMFDSKKLEKEKSFLIKDLNYNFGKGKIFEEKVENYRTYATIQTLLNEWRSNQSNFDKTTEYEIKLHNSLTEQVIVENKNAPLKVDKITYKLMQEMFDKKYKTLLNGNQQKLISLFIEDDETKLIEEFKNSKKECIKYLNTYMSSCTNKVLKEKNSIIINNLKSLNENLVNKDNLQKFLTVEKLKEELLGE